MPNMSYCQFENTSEDLGDCLTAIREADSLSEMSLSPTEKSHFEKLSKRCQEFIDEYERLTAI